MIEHDFGRAVNESKGREVNAGQEMNKELYLARRNEMLAKRFSARSYCAQCRKALRTCYCDKIQAFASSVTFVILIHPAELKRSVATGRMTHLCVNNSRLIEGVDFSDNHDVQAIMDDTNNFCVLLFPDRDALDISALDVKSRAALVPHNKKLVVFVLDGTWDNARSMKRLSSNLRALPRICFSPVGRSRFREVRKQPDVQCMATVEAVHHLIELFDDAGFAKAQTMLDAFEFMVQQQINFAEA